MEKLCIFCTHFHWLKEEMWGMGSTLTGPMMEGGDATCGKGHQLNQGACAPMDEGDWRQIILTATNCKDYNQVKV